MATAKQANRLTARARDLGLNGDVVARPANGVGWQYQWCPPSAAQSCGLGDSAREAWANLARLAQGEELRFDS